MSQEEAVCCSAIDWNAARTSRDAGWRDQNVWSQVHTLNISQNKHASLSCPCHAEWGWIDFPLLTMVSRLFNDWPLSV